MYRAVDVIAGSEILTFQAPSVQVKVKWMNNNKYNKNGILTYAFLFSMWVRAVCSAMVIMLSVDLSGR